MHYCAKRGLAIISETGKAIYGLQNNLAGTFTGSVRTKKPIQNFGEKGTWAYPVTAEIFLSIPYYLRNG